MTKMLNITVHQRNADQSCETSAHSRREELPSNRPQMANAARTCGRGPLTLLMGMQTGAATMGNSMELPQKTKNGTII